MTNPINVNTTIRIIDVVETLVSDTATCTVLIILFVFDIITSGDSVEIVVKLEIFYPRELANDPDSNPSLIVLIKLFKFVESADDGINDDISYYFAIIGGDFARIIYVMITEPGIILLILILSVSIFRKEAILVVKLLYLLLATKLLKSVLSVILL